MVRQVYVCEKCGQRWNYSTDAREHEEKCDGTPIDLRRTLG